ncbi:MAG TPA: glycosyltransferase family 39 protein, partial [Thermoanaerobaculia bacterium]|nr:glycosyltransferase family 39 protein [Thermoanaerobaculia bacterium]
MEITTASQTQLSARAETEKRARRLFFWGLLAILVMTAALRVHGLGVPSFDGDEMYAVRIHGLTPASIGALFGRSAFHDLHPPLSYYAFLVWNQVFGLDEAAVRALPVLWGLVAVAAIGLIARRLGGNLAGLAAALLLAFNPLHIAYSQEARPYSQAVALSLLALLFLLRSLTEGRRRDRLLYAAFCALAIYSHYFALLALAPHGLALLWLALSGDEDSRRAARQTLLAFVCGFATYLGWVPALAHQMSESPEGPTLDVYELGDTPMENLAVTTGYLRDVAGLGEMPYLLPASLAAAILLVFAVTWKRGIAPAAAGGENEPILPPRAGIALLVLALAGGAVVAALAPAYLLPPARATLEQMGYSVATVERESRSLLSFVFFVPAALFTVGALVATWRRVSVLLGRLPRLGEGRPLPVPVLLGILFVVPATATVILATGGARFLSERNLLLFLPPLCLALAVGLARLASRRAWRLATLPLLFALGLSAVQYDP